MPIPSSHDVTQLLKAWAAGDEQALEKLTPLVYEQLHRVAQRYMATERPATLCKPRLWYTKSTYAW